MTVAAAWETIRLGRFAKMGSDDGMDALVCTVEEIVFAIRIPDDLEI